jgi:hypothetical protein
VVICNVYVFLLVQNIKLAEEDKLFGDHPFVLLDGPVLMVPANVSPILFFMDEDSEAAGVGH